MDYPSTINIPQGYGVETLAASFFPNGSFNGQAGIKNMFKSPGAATAISGITQAISPGYGVASNGIVEAGGTLAQGLAKGVAKGIGISSNPIASAGIDLGIAGLSKILGKDTNYSDVGSQIADKVAGVASAFGPIGMGVGAAIKLANMIGSQTVEGVEHNKMDQAQLGSSYNLSQYDREDKTFGLFGIGKANKYKSEVRKMKGILDRASDVADESYDAQMRAQYGSETVANRNKMQNMGGVRIGYAKKGGLVRRRRFSGGGENEKPYYTYEPNKDGNLLKTVLSFVPVVGDAIDLHDTATALSKGDFSNAVLSAIGLIPIPFLADAVSKAGKAAKIAGKAKEAYRTSDGRLNAREYANDFYNFDFARRYDDELERVKKELEKMPEKDRTAIENLVKAGSDYETAMYRVKNGIFPTKEDIAAIDPNFIVDRNKKAYSKLLTKDKHHRDYIDSDDFKQSEYLGPRNDGINGEYDKWEDRVMLYTKDPGTYVHELNHRFYLGTDGYPLSQSSKDIATEAYQTVGDLTSNASIKLSEKLATNTQLRERLYRQFMNSHGRVPNSIEEFNEYIRTYNPADLATMAAKMNDYGLDYINAVLRHSNGNTDDFIRRMDNIKKALIIVPSAAGAAAITTGKIDNKDDKNESYKKGGLFDYGFLERIRESQKAERKQKGGVISDDNKHEETNNPQSFKNGGSFNVIPSGNLHKERHHLEDKIEGLDKVSKKGIPVVTVEKDGTVKQHAEIERDELVLRRDVAVKLDELYDSDDENAELLAGQLLMKELFENTHDNTGLFKRVKVKKS